MTALYHYCPTSSFVSIVSNKSIWLSSMNMSNDSMEGKLVACIIDRLAKTNGLDELTTKKMLDAAYSLELEFDGLCFCLSEDGDLLSQWRAYASDAKGLSIGFSKDYLQSLSENIDPYDRNAFTLEKVEYDASTHDELARPVYEEIKRVIERGIIKYSFPDKGNKLWSEKDILEEHEKYWRAVETPDMVIMRLSQHLYSIKSPAFREEKEWRLLSYTIQEGDNTCFYRALIDRIVPYRSYELVNLKLEPIREVIIGSKNHTPTHVVENILDTNGFHNVTVRRSSATYR